MGSIKVSVEQIEWTQKQMNELNEQYSQLYRSLFDQIDLVSEVWQGKDKDAFLNQIHGFEDDFIKMHDLLEEYSLFLKKSANAYRSVQDQAELKARSLIQ